MGMGVGSHRKGHAPPQALPVPFLPSTHLPRRHICYSREFRANKSTGLPVSEVHGLSDRRSRCVPGAESALTLRDVAAGVVRRAGIDMQEVYGMTLTVLTQ
jgi:hypothetical protein